MDNDQCPGNLLNMPQKVTTDHSEQRKVRDGNNILHLQTTCVFRHELRDVDLLSSPTTAITMKHGLSLPSIYQGRGQGILVPGLGYDGKMRDGRQRCDRQQKGVRRGEKEGMGADGCGDFYGGCGRCGNESCW